MLTWIENRRERLLQFCQRYRVQRLALFGSAVAEDAFDPQTSDLDWLGSQAPPGNARPSRLRCVWVGPEGHEARRMARVRRWPPRSLPRMARGLGVTVFGEVR